MDRKFVITGLGYAIVGLLLGIYMASTKNHSQLVTHAHIMLIGFVVSFIYGVCHKLWLPSVSKALANVQFYVHQVGTFFVLVCLYFLYAGAVSESILGPILGVSSILVLAAMILMKIMIIKSTKNAI
ncbi:TonB-dependent receptor [Aliiglaciecola litoralis]|uniref:TonB-dependent receptor n=1 Tax=Aliiglaciecola litoralis TaxID=582857 RepID=A0ABP3WVU8_9ALTE